MLPEIAPELANSQGGRCRLVISMNLFPIQTYLLSTSVYRNNDLRLDAAKLSLIGCGLNTQGSET